MKQETMKHNSLSALSLRRRPRSYHLTYFLIGTIKKMISDSESLISFGSTDGAEGAMNEEEEMNDSGRLCLEGLVDSSSALERLDSLEYSFSTMQMSASNMFESKLQAKLLQSLPELIAAEEGGVDPVAADGISKKNTEREETVNGAIRPWELLKTMNGEYTPSTNEGIMRARETFERDCCGREEQHKDTQKLKARESFEDRLRKKMSGESTLPTSDKWEPIASSSVAVTEARKVKARETFEQRLLKKMSGEYGSISNTNQATNTTTPNGKGGGHPTQTRKPKARDTFEERLRKKMSGESTSATRENLDEIASASAVVGDTNREARKAKAIESFDNRLKKKMEEQDGKGVAPGEPKMKPTLSFCDLLEVKMTENRRAKDQREKPHSVCASFTAGVRLDKETGMFRRYFDAQGSFEDQLKRSMSEFDMTSVRSLSTIRSKDSHLRKAVRDVESVPKIVEK